MYKLVLVGEKSIITEGSSALIDWQASEVITTSKQNYEIVMTLAKEQFFRDFIKYKRFNGGDLEVFYKILNIDESPLRLIIVELKETNLLGDCFKLIQDKLYRYENNNILIQTIIDNRILILLKEYDDVFKLINKLKRIITDKYEIEINLNLSELCTFYELPELYKNISVFPRQRIKNDYLEVDGLSEENSSLGHNKLAKKIKNYVKGNIDNPELSLKWIANNLMFMDETYLSKVFSRDTGERFSNYLNSVRMERAKEVIRNGKENRIYEIAQSVGFGENPQYFSQLFKKYTGLSPTEYKKTLLEKTVF
jgi:YesN/AraC family two-component response regulator